MLLGSSTQRPDAGGCSIKIQHEQNNFNRVDVHHVNYL